MARRAVLSTAILVVAGVSVFKANRQGSLPVDVVIVGAGISGLSAALEAARGGARVTVLDVWSVFGGHAVMSEGGVAMVGTPVQEALGVRDTPALAFNDFVRWGEDPDTAWVRYYADSSRTQIYDWLTALGVTFDTLQLVSGNSVPRFHRTFGRGLGLVSPIYRATVQQPAIAFEWNVKVTGLLVEGGHVVGVRGRRVRTNEEIERRGRTVILATGGFQSNLEMVRKFWPKNLPFPDRILAGSGVNSVGSGLEMARRAGAALHNLDHQWNYATGLVDPRHPGGWRGLNARNPASIWVNAQGRRFVNEQSSNKVVFPELLQQRPATYWAIFDETGKSRFWIAGSDWGDFRTIEKVIFGNPALVKSASSIQALAAMVGLPPTALIASVKRYNDEIDRGTDQDFSRFSPGLGPIPPKIVRPPYYAVQFFPLTRKSMGGVRIDRTTRVLDEGGRPIPGLYAVGEVTGLAGINGKAGLEGTFLGPSILTGRVAGAAVVTDSRVGSRALSAPAVAAARASLVADQTSPATCSKCHAIEQLVAKPRAGYSHFELVHRVVLSRGADCRQCHAMGAPGTTAHRIDRLAQIETCKQCHVAVEH